MKKNKPSVLITGSNGFVGQALTKFFKDKHFTIINMKILLNKYNIMEKKLLIIIVTNVTLILIILVNH